MIGPIDVDSLEVKPDSQKISIPSKRKGQYGQARENYHIPKPAMVTIKTTEIPPVLLAAAFMGLESPINQGAETLIDLPVVLPVWPKWAPFGKSNITSTGLAIKEGAKVLVVGTDIEVNYALGLVWAVKGSSAA
uniref:phage tail tube protein n=1 Tax=Aeromonas jandaei TaxID=650 RepID=UPI002AA0D2E6|nr:hypothetical protein [Aeromonas jandaei]